MKHQPPASSRSFTRAALAAVLGLLLLTSLAGPDTRAMEALLPLVDDGGSGGIGNRELADNSRSHQSLDTTQTAQEADTVARAGDSKAMLPFARTERMKVRAAFGAAEHADDAVYCFFCFSYR